MIQSCSALPPVAAPGASARLARARSAVRPASARRSGVARRPGVCTASLPPPPPPPPPPPLRATALKTTSVAQVAVAPPPPALPTPAVPLLPALGAASVALLALLLWRPWVKRGSLGKLASRGVGLAVAEERDVDDERFFKGMMDGVRTTATPELSAEAIESARERRRANTRLDRPLGEELSGASVPTNHPWATSKGRLSAADEEAKRAEVMRRNATPRRSMGQDAEAAE